MLGGGRRTTDSVQLGSRLDRVFDVNCNLSPRAARDTVGCARLACPAAFHFHVESPRCRVRNARNIRGWHANHSVDSGAHRIACGVGG
jgi:hypothetical protein